MKSQILKKAWEIWILPLVILQAFAFVIVSSFIALRHYIQSDDNAVNIAENLITFTLGGALLSVCYSVMNRYERAKQIKVRRRTKRCMLFFVGVYFFYSTIIIIETAKEILQQVRNGITFEIGGHLTYFQTFITSFSLSQL